MVTFPVTFVVGLRKGSSPEHEYIPAHANAAINNVALLRTIMA
jgi:hypothetical protein